VCVGVSAATTWVVGLLGPSVVQPPLGARTLLPPWETGARPGAWLTAGLVTGALLVGAVGVGLGLLAGARGWRPDPRRLLVAGVVVVAALVLVPPMGSADHLSYAAYGRIAAAGGDPYVVAPGTWAGGRDPVTSQVERPWRWAPSVYGPAATAEQQLASEVAGQSLRATVWLLMLVNAGAFVLAGLLLHRLVRGAPPAQTRAALLWTLNPLLLYELVAGMHVDTLAAAAAVAAIAVVVLRPGPTGALLGGLLLGIGVSTKAPVALVGLALLWALRRSPVRAGLLVLATAAASIPSYLLAGPHVFDQLRRAAYYVSLATPWRLVLDDLTARYGHDHARVLISRLSVLLALLLAALLARLVPRRSPSPERAELDSAARAAFVLTAAWVFAAPYTLPWYDALVWMPLALLPASGLDLLVLARTTLLAVAYVPGRVTGVPAAVERVGLDLRATYAPRLLLALMVALALAALLSAVPTRIRPRPRRAQAP
jgi:hypothetical protein